MTNCELNHTLNWGWGSLGYCLLSTPSVLYLRKHRMSLVFQIPKYVPARPPQVRPKFEYLSNAHHDKDYFQEPFTKNRLVFFSRAYLGEKFKGYMWMNIDVFSYSLINYRIRANKRTAFYIFLRVSEWLYIQILYVLIMKIWIERTKFEYTVTLAF